MGALKKQYTKDLIVSKTYLIITSGNCSWCDKALGVLESQGVDWWEIDLSDPYQPKAILGLIQKAGLTTVPQVFDEDGQYIGGYSELVKKFGLDRV